MLQAENTQESRPPFWIPGIWAVTAMLSFVGTLYTAWLFSQVPKGEPDQHREPLSRAFECFVLSCIVTAFGLIVMFMTAPFYFRALRRAGAGTVHWRIGEYVLFLFNLSPWILAALKIATSLKMS
jgi:hypothetical protein